MTEPPANSTNSTPRIAPTSTGTVASANGVYSAAVSPSLLGGIGTAVAFELKFRISDAVAREMERWAQRHLAFDPHADAALDNAYRIHTLYLDTAALDVYHRTQPFRRRKFRLRRYGTERGLFLERKTRSGERVRKRRTLIPDTELPRLQLGHSDPAWEAYWFQRRLLARRLQPTCHITYDRVAHVGSGDVGPMRLTLDRHIHGAPMREWHVAEAQPCLPLLTGEVVLELKYRTALPALFKRLVQDLQLNPQPVSKYRLCVEAWSLHKAEKEAG